MYKARRGAKCDMKNCRRRAEFWSGGFRFQFWDADLNDYGPYRLGYRCSDHVDPAKWFPLEEEDYET